jgi:hypothetical protein
MLPATPLQQRGSLLSSLREKDARFNWQKVFDIVQQETTAEISQAISQGEVTSVAGIDKGLSLIKNAVVGLTILAGAIFTKFVLLDLFVGTSVSKGTASYALLHAINTFASFIISVSLLLIVLMFMAGVVQLTFAPKHKTLTRKVNKALEMSPVSKRVKLLIPAPITYHLSSSLGPEGEVLAVISRKAPEIKNQEVHSQSHTVGTVLIGTDEDTAEVTARFEALLDEVGEIEEAADLQYKAILEAQGMDEDHLIEAEADLRLRAEKAKERKMLNQNVVESLNKQDKGLRAASASINSYEENLALEPGVTEL